MAHIISNGRNVTWLTVSGTTVSRRLLNQELCGRQPFVCVSLNLRHTNDRLCWASGMLHGPGSNLLLYSSQTIPGLLWKAIQVVC